jgi:hypothetical protein
MILNAVLGAVVAIFIVWSIGHIAALRIQIKEARSLGEENVVKLRMVEIEKEAIATHCNELRNLVAQLSARVPIAYFTDEQILKLVKAIFDMANPPKLSVN